MTTDDLETLQRAMRLFADHVRKVWQAIPDSLRKAAHGYAYALHTAYRHKTRRRNRR